MIDAVLSRIDANLDASLERLFRILEIPSVSTDPAYADEVRRAAEWAAAELASLGFEASVRRTRGHPMVVAHSRPEGAERRVLFYGHYDVQPPDPLNEWRSPPFSPVLSEIEPGRKAVVARGACDDKGQFMTFIEAVRAWRDAAGAPPVAVTVLLEGEEETGSPSLAPFLAENAGELKADVALVCDTGMWDADTPSITTMLRGLVMEEVTIRGPDRDLHSGLFGGAAINPIRVLAKVIAAIHDENGRVAIPGFYDGVGELPGEIAAQWRGLGMDETAFLGQIDLKRPAGERDRSVLEQIWARPTCDVNGIWGGYTASGSKTVIPSEAHAKLSFRLVGDQDPAAVRDAFRAFVGARLPEDCSVEFKAHGGSRALRLDTSNPHLARAREALEDEWGRPAVLIGSGGSIPIVGAFKRDLDMDALMVGFTLDDDRMHSPNEKYDLKSFHKGIRSWARILDALAR